MLSAPKKMDSEMKEILFAALALATMCSSTAQANELAALPRAGGGRFAAMSLANGQGLRAIVSNVIAPSTDTQIAPCQVQVSFIGADGSLLGNAARVQLKAGESTSVSASQPSKLVRAIVSVGDVVDSAKVCALRTSVEIFDMQTGVTFVSVPGESTGDCSVSVPPAHNAARKNISVRENAAPAAISLSPPAGTTPPKTKPPVLAATPPPVQR
jgi:hypothetical protein